MKKEFQPDWFAAILILGILLMVGCTANPTSSAPTSTRGIPVSTRTQIGTSTGAGDTTPTPAQARPNRVQASPTLTAESSATVTAAVILATQTPPVYPTPTISAAGKMALPDQIQPVNFSQNASSMVLTVPNFNNGIYKAYQLNATAGQILHLVVNGSANLQVIDPAQNPASPIVVMPGTLNVAIAQTGSYTLGLTGLGDVTVGLFLSPASAGPVLNAPAPSQVQAVQIPAVPLSVSFPSKADPSAPVGYSFEAQACQTLNLLLTGNVAPFVVAPDGNTIVPDTDPVTHQWQFFLPESGKTTLVLLGSGAISVTARLTPAQTAVTLPAAQVKNTVPISITPKNSMITLNTVFIANQPLTYVTHLDANQILTISASGMAGVTKISGPDGSDVTLTHSMYSTQWEAPISRAGDYTIVLAGSGPSTIHFSIP